MGTGRVEQGFCSSHLQQKQGCLRLRKQETGHGWQAQLFTAIRHDLVLCVPMYSHSAPLQVFALPWRSHLPQAQTKTGSPKRILEDDDEMPASGSYAQEGSRMDAGYDDEELGEAEQSNPEDSCPNGPIGGRPYYMGHHREIGRAI